MKRVAIFLGVTFVLTWAYEFGVVYPVALGAIDGIPQALVTPLIGAAMFFPALSVLITRLITHEGFKNSLIKSRGFKKPLPWFLLAWFGPPILTALGAALYFCIFPHDFDPSMSTFIAAQQQAVSASGATINADTLRAAMLIQLPFLIVIAPVLNIFTTFGEEWGWRGYLVPKLGERVRIVPNMLISGTIWGLWHAPIIALGHNYGTGYPGWPFGGIIAMCIFCIVMGIYLSYVTIRTGSCLAAAIGHGALNAFASLGIMFSLSGGNPFVGPLPVGIVGGIGYIAVAALMLWDLHRREKAGTLTMPHAGLPDGVRKESSPATPPVRA